MSGCDVAVLRSESANKWKVVCEHLKCAPPVSPFPEVEDLGQRRLLAASVETNPVPTGKDPKRDNSPWVVKSRREWRGIRSALAVNSSTKAGTHVSFNDCLEDLDTKRWLLRDDTFAGNLALFRPYNV